MSTRAIRRGATTIAAAGGLLVLSAAYASASGRATQANTYAHAASGPSYVVSFSPNKPNEDSDLSITLTDPQQPTSVTFGLPAGSTLNLGAVPICSAATRASSALPRRMKATAAGPLSALDHSSRAIFSARARW